MITIENDSVKVHVKSIVYDPEQYRYPVYWMVAVGPRVALQSIFASLVNKRTITLAEDGKARPRKGYPWEYSKRRNDDSSLAVPEKGKTHAVYKKLQSGLSAMVLYSSLTKADSEDHSQESVVMLCRENEDKQTALFHFLNNKIRVPLHEEWRGWLWGLLSKDEGNMRELKGHGGMTGFYLFLEGCETVVRNEIGKAIRKGTIKI
jgi:hypothetical protein